MNKTLSTIQTISKVGKVLSKIAFIFSLVGLGGYFAGLLSLILGLDNSFEFGDVTVKGLIEIGGNKSVNEIYAELAVGFIFVAGAAVIAKFTERYFKNELAAGTPFTFSGAKELNRLGWIILGVGAGCSLIAFAAVQIMKIFMTGVSYDFDITVLPYVGMAVVVLIMSLICRYGAEMNEKHL